MKTPSPVAYFVIVIALVGALGFLARALQNVIAKRWLRVVGNFLSALSGVALAGITVRFVAAGMLQSRGWSLRDFATRIGGIATLGVFTVAVAIQLAPLVVKQLEHMGFAAFVAARHVRSVKSGSLTLVSILAIMGVAVSSGVLTVTTSVMGGFNADLQRKILGNSAHVIVDQTSQASWKSDPQLIERIRQLPGVVGATAMVRGEGMLSSGYNRGGVIVKGIDPATVNSVIDFHRLIEVGSFDYLVDPEPLRNLPPDTIIGYDTNGEPWRKGPSVTGSDTLDPAVRQALDTRTPLRPGIIVGRELAKTLHLYLGDPVTLVSPLGELGPAGLLPKMKRFYVAGIFYSGYYEYDVSHVYVTHEVARDFVGIGDEVHEIEVRAKDAEQVETVTPLVSKAVGNPELRVRDWREMNRSLFAALKLERVVMFALLIIVIVVSGFCIVSILSLMVTEKSREIALLKAIGAKSRDIMLCFFFEGVTISFIGTFIGLSVGLGICAGLAFFGLKPNPEQTYIERIPVTFNILDYVGITVAAIIGSSFASIFPSIRAAAVNPVDGLRHD